MNEQACSVFVRSAGAAHPWCDSCGWRWDFHPDAVATAHPHTLASLPPDRLRLIEEGGDPRTGRVGHLAPEMGA